MRKKIEKTNKEKMLDLFTACVNNRSFYDNFYKTEKNTNKEKIVSGYQTDVATKITRYCYEDNRQSVNLKKLEEWGYKPVIQKEASVLYSQSSYFSDISIYFEDSPTLKLTLIEKEVNRTDDEKIELYKTFEYRGFWKWIKFFIPSFGDEARTVTLIKNEIEFTHFYVLSHGTIKEELSLEEGKLLADIYELKIKEVNGQIDLDKLNKRITQFVK